MKLIKLLVLYTMLGFSKNTTAVYPNYNHLSLSKVMQNKNWQILAEAKGNLGTDAKEYMVVILESKDSILEKRGLTSDELKTKARIILVLLRKKNNFHVIAQNNVFIARSNEGGITRDFTPTLSITNKQLKLFYQKARGEIEYIFEVIDNDIVLVEAKRIAVSHQIFKTDTIDFRKRVLVIENRPDPNEPVKTKIIPLNPKQGLKRLSELEIMETWEVAESIYF